jgi:hypothetical protein
MTSGYSTEDLGQLLLRGATLGASGLRWSVGEHHVGAIESSKTSHTLNHGPGAQRNLDYHLFTLPPLLCVVRA